MKNDLASFLESFEQNVLKSFLVSFWSNAQVRDKGKASKAVRTKDNEKGWDQGQEEMVNEGK